MSKHTPGPWLIDGRTVYALNSSGYNHMSIYVPRQLGPGSTIEEEMANVRLIAAAPDMLELLLYIVNFRGAVAKAWPLVRSVAKANIAKIEEE